jgi:parallel beta-helix repeat protein
MTRRIIAFWLGLTMMLGLIVMVDVTVDFTFTVGGETLYVNKTGSGGAFTSIQHAINYSQDGGTVFVYSGTYYERVLVNKTINLTGENRETTIINVSGSGDVVLITAPYVNMTGFTITNDGSSGSDAGLQINSDQNKIYGNNIFLNNRYGIHLYFSDNNNITNNNVSYNGIAIYLYESSWNNIIGHDIFSEVGSSIVVYSNSNNNIIAHNTLSSINRSGITIYTSKWNNLTENTIHKGGIFVFGGLVQHWNTHYIDTSNSVNGKPILYWKDRTGGTVPLGAGQVILANCVNVAVENQNISNCPAPVELGFSSNCNITKNNATNGQYGILLCRSNDNTIIGNNASSNLYGIYLDYSQRNNILFNEPYDNGYGVILDFSKENNITNNILYDNAYAILLDRSDWNNITDNNASHNLWGALIGMNSNGNTVEDNIVYDNAHGIHIVNAHWNHIIYNNILSNFAAGINIDDDACWNEITNNNITNNDNGIRIMHIYAENNKLFHNSFIGNNRHAIDMTIDKNEWDNGYPSGGNYWSDYTGVDYFKGPNQDQPGSDGIGDTNYSIDSDSVDHYPLIEPYTYKPFDNYTILKQGWNLHHRSK